MSPQLLGETLVLASHNPKKLAELAGLLEGSGVTLRSAADLGLAEPEETASDFRGNATIKALAAAEATGCPSLADDSGLEVIGLDGAPGVHSARWAGQEQDYPAAMARIVDALTARFGSFAAADKRAAFVTVVCLARPDGGCTYFDGRVDGTLIETPRGTGGFGYDPMFIPLGESRSMAELTPDEKDAVSHRGQAMRAFAAACLPER